MDAHDLMLQVDNLLEEARTGVLATLDSEGRPRMRWLSPTTLKGRGGALYAVTSPDFQWVQALYSHPDVQWMIQNPALTKVVHLQGRVQLIDNPSLKAEVLKSVGKRLSVFWKVNRHEHEMVVLETSITEGCYFLPVKGEKVVVKFPANG